jgi:hypothetical protein
MRRVIASLITALAVLLSCNQEGNPSFDVAIPVWQEGADTVRNLTLSFRNVLEVKSVKPTSVRLACSSDYRMTVNGSFVSHGPCVAAHGFYRVDEYDITSFLHEGSNTVCIEVAGYNQPSYYLVNQPAFLQAEVKRGHEVLAATGRDFKAYSLCQRRRSVPKFSFQRTASEYYALSPDFRQWSEDPSWEDAESEVKLMETASKTLIGRRVHNPDYTRHDAVQQRPDLWKFDVNSSGFLEADVEVAEPSVLRIAFDEVLDDQCNINLERVWGYHPFITYELQPGSYSLESFEPYTMMYAQVEVLSGDCRVSRVGIRDYGNSDVHAGTFHSSDGALDSLFEAARETLRQNSVDLFTDCPGRERAGWLCDAFFSSRVAFDLSGNTLVEKNFLENYLLPEKFPYIPEGMLPECYPADNTFGAYNPNWAMWFVLQLDEYVRRSGDTAILGQAHDRIYALIDFFSAFENEDGLLENLKWVFVEWSAANDWTEGVNYPTNMLYARMLEVASALYGDAALQKKCERIRATVREQSFDGAFFCDHSIRRDGTLRVQEDHRSEVCQYYAFYMQTATPETYPDLWERLLDEMGPGKTYLGIAPANAFIGNYLRLECLSRAGRSAQIAEECKSAFLPMVEQTGTLWENMTATASCNHGFASHLAHVLYRDILGFSDVDPVHRTVTVRLGDSGLQECEGTLPVGKERITLSWKKENDKFVYRLDAPSGWKTRVISDSETLSL